VAYGTFVLADHLTETQSDAKYVEVAGDTMTGNLSFGDNDKAIFGAELEIYSDATHARIREYGSGQLKIQGDNMQLLTSDGASTYLEGNASTSAVTLYHASNSPRLATTSTGIDVTGTVTADGLTVDGAATITVTDNSDTLTLVSTDADATVGPVLNLFRNSASPADNDVLGRIVFKGEDSAGNDATFARIEAIATDVTNGSEDGRIDFFAAKDDSFSAALSIAGQNVGIGTSSPAQKLDVAGNMAVSQGSSIYLTNNSGYSPRLTNNNDVNEMSIYTNNQERVRIGDTYKRAITLGNFGSSTGTYGIGQDGYDGVAYTWMYANASYGASAVGLGFDNAGTITPALTVRNGGNVGIGTGASPAEKLHIEGTNPKIRLLNNSTSASGLEWWNDYGGVDHVNTSINWNEGSANWEFKSFRSDAQSGYPYGNIQFYNGSNSTPTLKMNITTAGAVTTPYQPSVAGKGLHPRNSGNASYVQLNSNLYFDTVHHNVGSHFNNSTGVFTCPVAGMYFVFASFLMDDDSGVSELCRFGWFKNGTEVIRAYDNMRSIEAAGRYDGMLTASTVIQCSANDTLTVKVTNGAIHSGGESHFNIHLLG